MGTWAGSFFDPAVRLRDQRHTGRFKHFFPLFFSINQSEDRKSFRLPFLTAGLSSRIRILLRRCTTQFLALGVLEDEELEPEVVEEVEPLRGRTQRRRESERVVAWCCLDGKASAGFAELGYLGVCEGVLLFPGVFGVDVLDLLADWGVLLCLPALPGVPLWVFASEARKSLFTPLCLDVVLQAWQVAI